MSSQDLVLLESLEGERKNRLRTEQIGAEKPLAYAIRRSTRARRIRIRVDPRGVELVMPMRANLEQGHAFVRQHRAWIERQLLRVAAATAQREPAPAGMLLFAGDYRPLPAELDAAGVRAWLQREARRAFGERVQARSAEMGLHPKRIFLREQRSRWGSCSARGNLSLNWRLIQAPPEVLDYVVVHELAHLREFNHSKRFWALVAAHCPDYKRWMLWLKQEGWKLRGSLSGG
jgi:predicted metal-dependent hydrolase